MPPKTQDYKLRFSPEQLNAYRIEAAKLGVPLAEWMRDACDEALRQTYAKGRTICDGVVVMFDDAAIARIVQMIESKDASP